MQLAGQSCYTFIGLRRAGSYTRSSFAWNNFVNFWEVSTIAKDQTQINEKIRAKELRLIGQDGEQQIG